jgi:hypothetical protein
MARTIRRRVVSNLLFFRRSEAYRSAAVEMIRKARAMPPGPERGAARRRARALRDLAKTEAWLEGKIPRLRAAASRREPPLVSPAHRSVAAGL